jgi:hypothetical protein
MLNNSAGRIEGTHGAAPALPEQDYARVAQHYQKRIIPLDCPCHT